MTQYQLSFYLILFVFLTALVFMFTATVVLWTFNEYKDPKNPFYTLFHVNFYRVIGRPQAPMAIYGKYWCFRITILGLGCGLDILIKEVEEPPVARPPQEIPKV